MQENDDDEDEEEDDDEEEEEEDASKIVSKRKRPMDKTEKVSILKIQVLYIIGIMMQIKEKFFI